MDMTERFPEGVNGVDTLMDYYEEEDFCVDDGGLEASDLDSIMDRYGIPEDLARVVLKIEYDTAAEITIIKHKTQEKIAQVLNEHGYAYEMEDLPF